MANNAVQYLKHGKALCGKVFSSFVETFNSLVDFKVNLKGDADRKDGNGHITLDRTDPSHPVIRCNGCSGVAAGESEEEDDNDVECDEASITQNDDDELTLVGFSDAYDGYSPTKKTVTDDETQTDVDAIEWVRQPQPDGNTIDWADEAAYGSGGLLGDDVPHNRICLKGSFDITKIGMIPYLKSYGVIGWIALPWSASVSTYDPDDDSVTGTWMNPFVIVGNTTVMADPANIFDGRNYVKVNLRLKTAMVVDDSTGNTDEVKFIEVGMISRGHQISGIYTTPIIFSYE